MSEAAAQETLYSRFCFFPCGRAYPSSKLRGIHPSEGLSANVHPIIPLVNAGYV